MATTTLYAGGTFAGIIAITPSGTGYKIVPKQNIIVDLLDVNLLMNYGLVPGAQSPGAGGTPGGTTGQIQVNSAGSFGGLPTTGTNNVVLSTNATIATPTINTPTINGGTADSINLGSTIPGPAAVTTLNATGNISQGGTAFFGSLLSTIEGGQNYYGLISHITLDPAVLTNGPRNNQFVTTLNLAADSSRIWENLYSLVILNGPGRQLVEINTMHTSIGVNAGASFASGENYESSFSNSGTVTGRTAFLDLYFNNAGATTNQATVFYGQLTNSNATAGSIAEYDFINMAPMAGGGAVPTFYYFLKGQDTAAISTILGQVAFGVLVPAANTRFTLKASAGDSFLTFWESSAGAQLFFMRPTGAATFNGALTMLSTVVGSSLVSAPNYNLVGGAAGPTVTVALATGAGAGATSSVTGTQNAHVITITTAGVPAASAVIATVTIGGGSTTNGPVAIISAGNAAAAAALASVYAVVGTTPGAQYTLNSTAVALTTGTVYVFNVHTWSY